MPPGGEIAVYLGAIAMVRLKVFPGETLGLYRAGVYEWFDRTPLYESASEVSLRDARNEAAREAARHPGYPGGTIRWRQGQAND